MSLLKSRQDPVPEWPPADKELAMEAVQSHLTAEFLDGTSGHPLQLLWQRRDWLATAELLILGKAILHAEAAGSKRALQAAAMDLKGRDFGNRNGSAFELLACLMFDSPRHRTVLAKDSEPGWDFGVQLPNECFLKVSCKALIPSAIHRDFIRLADEVRQDFERGLVRGDNLNAMVLLMKPQGSQSLRREIVTRCLREAIEAKKRDPTTLGAGFEGWFAGVNPLVPLADVTFWDDSPSYSFLAGSYYLADERRRLESKVEEAVYNLTKHSRAEPGKVTNAIVVKVPYAISLSAARNFVNSTLSDSRYQDIASIFVYRVGVASSPDMKTSFITHELEAVENPNARVPIRSLLPQDFQLSFSVPIGMVASAPTKTEMRAGDKIVDLSECYTYIRGHHYYVAKFDPAKGATFSLNRIPFVDTTWVVTEAPGFRPGQSMRLDFIVPPQDELVVF